MLLVFLNSNRLKNIIDYSLVLSFYLLAKFVTSTDIGPSNQGELNRYGYDCGNLFVTNGMVSDALELAFSEEGKNSIRSYVGPLYAIDMGYLTWPIFDYLSRSIKRKGKFPAGLWRRPLHQIVFSSKGEVIDVIIMTSNKDFAKCWRVDYSQPNPKGQDLVTSKDYYCGSRFIPNEDLKKSVRQKGPYFIVIDPKGRLKDVIVRVFGDGYVKCMPSNIDPPAYASNEKYEVNTRSSGSGFDCNGIFFYDDDLLLASNIARKVRTTGRNILFPEKYFGPPFDSPCLMWPIKPSRSTTLMNVILTGNSSKFRLVLTPDFDVMCVVIKDYDRIKKCEKKTIGGEGLNHDQNNYKCEEKVFFNEELVKTAEAACKKKFDFTKSYPRSYEGITFDVPGPYLIYPLIKGGLYFS
ncbi:hypothetical protein EPUL_005391, partial [Erysiphe pulchra]